MSYWNMFLVVFGLLLIVSVIMTVLSKMQSNKININLEAVAKKADKLEIMSKEEFDYWSARDKKAEKFKNFDAYMKFHEKAKEIKEKMGDEMLEQLENSDSELYREVKEELSKRGIYPNR